MLSACASGANMNKSLLILVALLSVACGGPRTEFTVSAQPDVDSSAVDTAVLMWMSAMPQLHITVVPSDGDVEIKWAPLPRKDGNVQCANTQTYSGEMKLNNAEQGQHCEDHLDLVIAHELGHYIGNRSDHTQAPYTIMFWNAKELGYDVTADDITYAEGK